jgi:hypothetical protein
LASIRLGSGKFTLAARSRSLLIPYGAGRGGATHDSYSPRDGGHLATVAQSHKDRRRSGNRRHPQRRALGVRGGPRRRIPVSWPRPDGGGPPIPGARTTFQKGIVRRLCSAPTLCYVPQSQLGVEARQSGRLNDNRKDQVWPRTN